MKLLLVNTNYFRKLFPIIIIIVNCILTVITSKLTQEEWHTLRFGGETANQWDISNGETQNGGEALVANVETDANIETNVQTVNVGKDKLVLVNDEGTIKMVRASQLPTAPKPESTTQSYLNGGIQSHDSHQYSSKTGSNNQQLSSNVRYITPNHGNGHHVSGLPITFAIGAKSNLLRQSSDDCPCRRSSEYPQIYLSAPEASAAASVNEKIKPRINMVRIIIEMPESLTKNVEEASRYAATQVKNMIVPSVVIHKHISSTENPITERKIKNVQEIIRKVVHLEEEDAEEEKEEDKPEEVLADNSQNNNYVRLKSRTNGGTNRGDENKRYVILRNVKNNGRRRIRKNSDRSIKGFDKYRKVIKIY